MSTLRLIIGTAGCAALLGCGGAAGTGGAPTSAGGASSSGANGAAIAACTALTQADAASLSGDPGIMSVGGGGAAATGACTYADINASGNQVEIVIEAVPGAAAGQAVQSAVQALHNGSNTVLRRKRRQFSQIMKATLPARKAMLLTTERSESAETRCTSPTSLFSLETRSPNLHRA